MRFTYIIVATITVAITTPVVAQSTLKNHYIVQDSVTERCNVVDIKPHLDGISAGLVYANRALAEVALAQAAMYEIPDCSIIR